MPYNNYAIIQVRTTDRETFYELAKQLGVEYNEMFKLMLEYYIYSHNIIIEKGETNDI